MPSLQNVSWGLYSPCTPTVPAHAPLTLPCLCTWGEAAGLPCPGVRLCDSSSAASLQHHLKSFFTSLFSAGVHGFTSSMGKGVWPPLNVPGPSPPPFPSASHRHSPRRCFPATISPWQHCGHLPHQQEAPTNPDTFFSLKAAFCSKAGSGVQTPVHVQAQAHVGLCASVPMPTCAFLSRYLCMSMGQTLVLFHKPCF